MEVREIMTRDPITIGPDGLVATAIGLMVERKIRHLPVVDEYGSVVGIITDRDLRSAAVASAFVEYLPGAVRRRLDGIGATIEKFRVKYAMTCGPLTTRPDAPVNEAAALMLDKHVGSLPVLENGKLVGIMTDRDAVRALAVYRPGAAPAPARRGQAAARERTKKRRRP